MEYRAYHIKLLEFKKKSGEVADKQLKTDHKTESSKPCLCSFIYNGIHTLIPCGFLARMNSLKRH